MSGKPNRIYFYIITNFVSLIFSAYMIKELRTSVYYFVRSSFLKIQTFLLCFASLLQPSIVMYCVFSILM